MLDETVVGSFLPKATVTLSSEDPYTAVSRTRADQKFSTKLNFPGLLSDPAAPEAARKVYVERLVMEYPEGANKIPENQQERLLEAFYVTKNGSVSEMFSLHGNSVRAMPAITMVANDLYPTSKTYLNLYKDNKNDNLNGAQHISQIITANDYQPVAFNTITPQSATQTISPDQWN